VTTDPGLIRTAVLTDLDDVLENLRAAATLGLGVRLHSFLIPGHGGTKSHQRWEIDLLTDLPVEAPAPTEHKWSEDEEDEDDPE
jgi:hypothetical protein